MSRLPEALDQLNPCSTYASNESAPNRQGRSGFFKTPGLFFGGSSTLHLEPLRNRHVPAKTRSIGQNAISIKVRARKSSCRSKIQACKKCEATKPKAIRPPSVPP